MAALLPGAMAARGTRRPLRARLVHISLCCLHWRGRRGHQDAVSCPQHVSRVKCAEIKAGGVAPCMDVEFADIRMRVAK